MIGEIVDEPNYIVSAFLPLSIFVLLAAARKCGSASLDSDGSAMTFA
jgi:hypothetical protein